MGPEKYQNLVQMLFEQARKNGTKPFLWAKSEGRFRSQSWDDVVDQVARMSRA